MRAQEALQVIGFSRRGHSCNHKARYPDSDAAEHAALDHRARVVCRGIDVYWCGLHFCWHIGHPGNRRAAHLQIIDDMSWFESWSRRN